MRARRGSYFPIGRVGPRVVAGDRVEFVVDSERLEDCQPPPPSRSVSEIGFRLANGASFRLHLPHPIEAGCYLGFGAMGSWE